MRTAKRIITASLTAIMIFQALAPSTEIFAQELNAAWNGSIAAAHSMGDAVESAKSTIAQFAEDTASSESSNVQEPDHSEEPGDANSGTPDVPSDGDVVDEGTSDGESADASDADAGEASDDADSQDEAEETSLSANEQLDLEGLKTALAKFSGSVSDDGTQITVQNQEGLIIVSNAKPEVYQHATITASGITGDNADLTGKASVANDDGSTVGYTFQGFGSEDHPFDGILKSQTSVLKVQVARTLYNGIKLTNQNASISLVWKGAADYSDPIVAGFVDGNSQALSASVEVPNATGDSTEGTVGIGSALIGTVKNEMSLSASYAFGTYRNGVAVNSAGNAGLLVNTLEAGANLTVKELNGLDAVKGSPSVSASVNGYNAGGLIGEAGTGATVKFENAVDVSKFSVTATRGSAGGLIGKADNLMLAIPAGVTMKPALTVGSAAKVDSTEKSTINAGGVIGSVSFSGDFTVTSGMFDFGEGVKLSVGSDATVSPRAGGLFGVLDLKNGNVTVQGGDYKSSLVGAWDDDKARGSYGGVVGIVHDSGSGENAALPKLTFEQGDSDKVKSSITRNKVGDNLPTLRYIGGAVGYIGSSDDRKNAAAVVFNGIEITCNGENYGNAGNGKFGGAVGVVSGSSVVDAKDVKVSASDAIGSNSYNGAGLIGSAWRAVVKLSGTTDLSEAKFNANNAAQLVYEDWSSLVFATGSGSNDGWTYKRPNDAVTIDDIYSYGEVIRLDAGNGLSNDLFTLDENYALNIKGQPLSINNNVISISSADDYAKLALAFQAYGQFPTVSGIAYNSESINAILSSTIEVDGTIDLKGTGLGGLMKDGEPSTGTDGFNETTMLFSGTLQGSGTIKLAIGEPYGTRKGIAIGDSDQSAGNGKIYRHTRLGVFSQVKGATFKNITVAGFMKFDDKHNSGVDAGALAARKSGGAVTVENVTVNTELTYDATCGNNNVSANVGGVFGQIIGETGTTTTFKGASKANAIIKSRDADEKGARVGGTIGYLTGAEAVTVESNGLSVGGQIALKSKAQLAAGGFIGQVAGSAPVTIALSGLTMGNSEVDQDFSAEGSDSKNAAVLAGGVVGYIEQGATGQNAVKKTVNITGLEFNSFNMKTDVSNSKSKTSGGLLGYSWGNTELTLGDDTNKANNYALTTKDATLTATGATGVGGLAYAASARWLINDYAIDLSGAKVSAPAATTLGLLICRGGSAKDNSDKVGIDPLTGLYIENAAHWETAYKVNTGNDAISAAQVANFDEWLADACRAGSAVDDCGANGVVSLHVKDGAKIDMTGDASKRNTYVNRTVFGNNKPVNDKTRYYYNLDSVRAKVATETLGDTITTPEELLLWSACRYAASGIAGYIAGSNTGIASKSTIGSTDADNPAEIDLDGFSYYPIDFGGVDLKVQNASITFHYGKISSEEQGNKDNAAKTQHANMHVGLIRNFSPATDANNSISVDNVTLCGSVGLDALNGGSGALVSGSVAGYANGSRIAGVAINGLVLDGLKVSNLKDAKDGFAPLLVKATDSYSKLEAKHISVKDEDYKESGAYVSAASSLFGKVGGESADMVTATFSEGICVPSKSGETIFTRASLLESFGYGAGKTGNATYTFYKKDEREQGYGVTYGKEIDQSDSEWVGKQYWYYDADTHGEDKGLVTDGDVTADKTNPKFGIYLPYVATRNSKTDVYHEIKVNHYVPNLTLGCGTYGDPYVLSDASVVYAATGYIRNIEAPTDGWQITIAKDQERLCTRRAENGTTDNEITYTFDSVSKEWKAADGSSLKNDVMHLYLQSAYYSVEPADTKDASNVTKIELDGDQFGGFGNESNPFRGVIVGNLKKGISGNAGFVINKGKNALQGLIPYSYGSVVKDLTVTYSGGANSIAYKEKNSSDVPNAFFGGVIGCILGGDNIIDGVKVSASDSFSVAGDTNNRGHLVPIGGYVGAIAGGGVIFRDMSDVASNWRSSTVKDKKLYDNPYVGRVIDGFAFTEGCELTNGDENYKINKLDTDDTGCVVTSDTFKKYSQENVTTAVSVQVNDAQGLLVLSAIISSGAGAGAAHTNYGDGQKDSAVGTYRGSLAYQGSRDQYYENNEYQFGNGSYGKVRNASYDEVGKAETNENEWRTATKDDRKAPGNQDWKGPLDNTDADAAAGKINSPYLVQKYANWATGYVCANRTVGIKLSFAQSSDGQGKTFDVSEYKTGFLGLSGRYYSNACVANQNTLSKNRRFITPLVACIDGAGATLKISREVKEYNDDDYRVSGVGGLFDFITYTASDKVKDSITANGGNSVRNLTFADCSVSLKYQNDEGKEVPRASYSDKDNVNVAVGCLAGVATSIDTQKDYGSYDNVIVDHGTIDGSASAGGLVGNAGYCSLATALNDYSKMVSDASGQVIPIKLVDCQIKNGTSIHAQSNAGGYVGKVNTYADAAVTVNVKQGAEPVIDGVIVAATIARGLENDKTEGVTAGGIVGLSGSKVQIGQNSTSSDANRIKVKNLTVSTDDGVRCIETRGAGGLVGRAENYEAKISHVFMVNSSNGETKYIGSTNGVKQASSFPNGTRYRSVGGLIGYAATNVKVADCSVSGVEIAAREASGGVLGETASGSFEADGVSVDGCIIDGAYSGGLLGSSTKNSVISIQNSSVTGCTFKKNPIFWSWIGLDKKATYSGGFTGDTKGTVRMVNVLSSENTFEEADYQGQLVGSTNAGINGIYVAGASVKVKESQINDIAKMIRFESAKDEKAAKGKIYIAFGDYKDTADDAANHVSDGTLYSGDFNTGVNAVAPYVATSPVSDVSVAASVDNDSKKLFGDGATITTAETIKNEVGQTVAGRYTYDNIGGTSADGTYQTDNEYDARSSASTFNTNNDGVPADQKVENDFPVLLIPGNDTTTVANYLNVVTNGGYSDALRFNGATKTAASHVEASAQTFTYDAGSKKFVASGSSTLAVIGDGTKNMSFRASSDWDNDKNRFTLLTVTFTENGQSYKVHVPIVVKRMLEVDFTATFTDGTVFNKDEYTDKGADYHTLSSYGDAMTGYLTWTYNEAQGEPTEYGWDTYLASGAAMGPLGKRLEFRGSHPTMPNGTQLTLVDTAHNNREYHYTVTGNDGDGGSVLLTAFVADDDSHYQEQWLSEIMGVTAEESASGAWVSCDELDASAGAKIGDKYYRPYKNGDTSPRYTLTVPKGEDGKEKVESENFYLVVRVPQSEEAGATGVNGYTATEFDNKTINSHVNCTLRPNGRKDADSHNSTASTYNIYSSYRQLLVDNADAGIVSMSTVQEETNYKLQFDVTDTVSFDAQEYNDKDGLYFKLSASLTNYKDGAISSATGFPAGISGDIKFYVSIGDTYYKWNGQSWVASTDADKVAVPIKQGWQSDGNDMSLVLSDENGNAIDLSGIRKLANATPGKAFAIKVTAEGRCLTMTEPACQAGIVAANEDTASGNHTKIAYRSMLSPHADKLETTSMSAVHEGARGYYRTGDDSSSKISLAASLTSQLGINVDDLKSADGTIALTGRYDFSDAKEGASKLDSAASVTYRLSLERRQDNGGYEAVGGNISDFVTVVGNDHGLTPVSSGSSIVFTDTKTGGKFATRDADSLALVLGFRVKVNTDVEGAKQFYSNYRLVLTARLYDGSGKEIDKPVNAQGLTGYDNSDYVTYTLTRVKTTGIDHSN